MGVYRNADSKHWWMYLENAPKAERKQRTAFLIGHTKTEQKASRKAADAAYHAAMLRLGHVAHGLPLPPTETDAVLFDTFAGWYDTNHIAHHKGRERERAILPRLRAAFGHLALTDPAWRETVIAWRTTRRETPTVIAHFGGPKGKKRILPPPSARTVNREVDLLQQILQAAVEAGHLPSSPLFGLEDLEITPPIRRIMSEAEEEAIARHLSVEDAALFYVSLDTLARFGDALDLRRRDDHGTQLDIPDPKNGTPLTVPISTRLRAKLDAVPVDPEQPEYYFPGRRGAATERDRRGGYAKALKRACERAGVPYGRARGGLTFHWATRRTGATRMIRRGGEKAIGVVQQIGGWKDPTVLIGIYQETITDEMRAAVETIGAQVPGPRPTLSLVPTPLDRASAVPATRRKSSHH